MKVLITGVAGFVGSTLVRSIAERGLNWKIVGMDNLSRRGSERNVPEIVHSGVKFSHGDHRNPSDFESLPPVEWVIDAAANPSVLAGIDGVTSSRQLVEHNLLGTINLLEYCRRHRAGFILLSTSRVYSIEPLASMPVIVRDDAFHPDLNQGHALGLTKEGIGEDFSTSPPVSLYGSTKVTSEHLALEYGMAFDFPVWINRCGVLAGAGQFGIAGQGIFPFWINAHLRRKQMKYIGFEGTGFQVRDCLHPRDLVPLIEKQTSLDNVRSLRTDNSRNNNRGNPKTFNISGGLQSAMSLKQLTDWCNDRFGLHAVASDLTPRPYDLPWVVLQNRLADEVWNWRPETTAEAILDEIAVHAAANPGWLELCAS